MNAFDPETLTNYEVGVKSTLFDQLRLNASIFFNDYKDIQLPINVCFFAPVGQQTPCASQANVGSAEVKGLEVEGTWRPTIAFTLDFSYAYLDFKYTEVTTDPNTGAPLFVGGTSTTPYTPKNKWSVGAQYRIGLGTWGDLTPRLDLAWQGDIHTSAINSDYDYIPSYYLMNGRLSWLSKDLKWEASIECTNLLDEYYYVTIFDLSSTSGVVAGQPGRPREAAFTLKRVWRF